MEYFHNLREKEEVSILLKTGWHMENSLLKDRVENSIISPERYYSRLKDSKEPHKVRLQVVIHYFTNGFNKSFTAQAFGTTTKTVRKLVERYKKYGEEGLKDKSRRPHTSPKKADTKLEEQVLELREKTNYGVRRIACLMNEAGIEIGRGGVWKILRRNGKNQPRKKLTIRRTGRRYYNPLDFEPFTFLQIDTKEIVDGDTLPAEIYRHFLDLSDKGVPMNQFTAIDIRTRNSFLAYGEEKSFANGWLFMNLVVWWLRAFGIKGKIVMQSDWGEENGGKSQQKIERMNKALAKLDAEITRIQKGKKEQNGYVERHHRTDDEEFYIPYGGEIRGTDSLFDYAYGWVRYYNTIRPHYGKELDGLTPLEYLKTIMPEVDSRIALMPPLFLDRITSHPDWKGGYDVCGHYT